MKTKNHDFGLYFWIHMAVIVIFYSSPWMFNWKLISFVIFLYYLQIHFIGGCVLSKGQFKKGFNRENFHHYYLKKLGFDFSEKSVRFAVDRVVPWVLLSCALVWQALLNHSPILF